MMKQNRIIKAVGGMLGTAALSLLMALSVFAANGKISFSDPSVEAGSEVNVTMKIAADGGATLSDATVTLKYPSDKLEFVSGTDADGGAGTIRVHGASNGQGTDTLEYNLKFKTQAAGEYTVSIDTYEVYDGAGQAVTIDHQGTSSVKVTAPESVSKDASLGTLEVTPGTLSPAFDPDTLKYSLTVGASIDKIGINALAADSDARVGVSGNENFQMGKNTVTVTVTAADGETTKNYEIQVTKEEGGPEEMTDIGNGSSDAAASEGVQLSSRGKTITIMNPTADVQIPEGLKSGTLSIDGQRVQGWIWGADADPQYCVVYGMNDQGELHFYRYDLNEKTIQRYFEDPLAADAVSSQEYTQLKTSFDTLSKSAQIRFLIICILAVISLVLLAVVVYLSTRLRNLDRNVQTGRRTRTPQLDHGDLSQRGAEQDDDAEDDELLRHDFDAPPVSEDAADVMDETQVIRRPDRRRHVHKDAGDTMEIPSIHHQDAAWNTQEIKKQKEDKPESDNQDAALEQEKASQEPKKTAEASDVKKQAEAAAAGQPQADAKDTDDDEFETFDL